MYFPNYYKSYSSPQKSAGTDYSLQPSVVHKVIEHIQPHLHRSLFLLPIAPNPTHKEHSSPTVLQSHTLSHSFDR